MSLERKRWLGWLLAGLLVTGLLGGLAFHRPFQKPAKAVAPALDPPTPPSELEPLPPGRQTFLVLGVDEEGEELGRADTMMVVSYDPGTQRVAMLSIPRDTWTLIPGHGYDKINHAYAYGGHQLAVDTVERLLGIEIDHWVTISFDGFIQIVDAVGGIEIDVEKRLYYVDPVDDRLGEGGLVIDIQPGLQRMDGVTALKYARFRADAEGDFGRMRRQKQVIQALMKKASNPSILARVPQLIPALARTIGTDLSVAQMLRLAAAGREALTRTPVTGTIEGEPMILDGIFYLATDIVAARTAAYEVLVGEPPDEEFLRRARQEAETYAAALAEARARSEEAAAADPGPEENQATDDESAGSQLEEEKPEPAPPETDPQPITIAVIDATGRGVYKEYVQQLQAAGFRVARTSRSQKVLRSTLLIDHAGQPEVEERLRAIFPHLIYVSDPDPQAEAALEIVLGLNLVEESEP